MIRGMRGFWRVGIAALCLAPSVVAQNVNLTSAGNNITDGVYVSPYYATVNGVANTPIVCNDFADDSHLNTSWTASIVPFSSLATGGLASTAWGAAGATVQLYEEAAWLTLGVFQQSKGTQGQINYSFAVWAVFDPSGVASWLTAYGDTTTYNAIFGPGGLLATAAGNSYSLGEFANFHIITPEVGGKTCTAGNCSEQEFFSVPEGGAALGYLIMAGLACLGAMIVRSRRQVCLRGPA
jgi:hypothetical protein